MSANDAYYAEILILVDGWPWNLSEFDFRTWFAPGSCPRALEPREIAGEIVVANVGAKVSGNRRAKQRKNKSKSKKAKRRAA